MKKYILLLFILVGLESHVTNAQSKFTTGDMSLDQSISVLTKYGRNNPSTFKKEVTEKYKLTEDEFKLYITKLSGGDMLMVFETAAVLNKTKAEITAYYAANRIKKTWQEILKDLGVSSNQFEQIKEKVCNNSIAK